MALFLACYVGLAVLVGLWARDKGRAGFLGFLSGLVLTPPIGAIIVGLLKDKGVQEKEDRKVSPLSWKLILASALATIMVGWLFHTPTPEENALYQAGQFGEHCMALNRNLEMCRQMCRNQYSDAALADRCAWRALSYRPAR